MHHLTDVELIDLAAGHVPAERRTCLHDHLSGCADCRQRYEETTQTWQTLGEWSVEAAKADLWIGLQARLREASPQPQVRQARSLLLWAGRIAAAFLLGAGVGHGVGRWSLPAAPVTIAQVPATEPTVDDETVARWLYLTSLDTRTPAGMADAVLRVANQIPEEATQ